MPNRQLTDAELDALFAPLVADVRGHLERLSTGDPDLLWALRRKLAKELTYDERGKPMYRRQLKLKKRVEQGERCALCIGELPEVNAVLNRLEAMRGYTPENTRLLCPACDTAEQRRRGYA